MPYLALVTLFTTYTYYKSVSNMQTSSAIIVTNVNVYLIVLVYVNMGA